MTKLEKYRRDLRDIFYFIDHVKNIDLRISLLKQLGYRIGIEIVCKEGCEKRVVIGKRREKRIQVAPNPSHSPIVQCVILEDV